MLLNEGEMHGEFISYRYIIGNRVSQLKSSKCVWIYSVLRCEQIYICINTVLYGVFIDCL